MLVGWLVGLSVGQSHYEDNLSKHENMHDFAKNADNSLDLYYAKLSTLI